MLGRMVRSRSIAVALLGFGVALWAACAAKQQNGQECLKADDCESGRCIQYVCIDPTASRPAVVTDTGTASETGADAAADAVDSSADTSTPDTATTDTGSDTGSSDDGASGG